MNESWSPFLLSDDVGTVESIVAFLRAKVLTICQPAKYSHPGNKIFPGWE